MSRLLDDVVREFSRLPGVGRRTALRLAMHVLRSREDDVAQMIRAIGDFRTGIHYCSRCNNLSDNDICEICRDPSRDRTTICVVEQVGDVLSIEKTGQYRGLYHVLGGVISPMAGIAPSDLKIDLLINNISAETMAVGTRDIDAIPTSRQFGANANVDADMNANSDNVETEATGGGVDVEIGAGIEAMRTETETETETGVGAGSKVKEVILAISTTVEGETTLFYILNRLRAYKHLKITTIARGIGFGDEIEYADELTISHAIANRREV